jgi:hypothetical protein
LERFEECLGNWRRPFGADEPSRGQPVELGHVEVHEHDIGAEPPCLLESFAPAAGFADDFDSARLEQAAQSTAKNSDRRLKNAHDAG